MTIVIGGNTLSGNFNSNGDSQNAPNMVTNGLVLWYDAANNASYINSSNYYDCGYGCQYYASNPGCTNCNTQWKDMSGYGYDGTFNNATVNYSYGGGSIYFNGSNINVTVPPAALPTGNQLSFCVWAYGIDAIAQSIIECRDSGGSRTLNVHLPWVDGNIYFDCGGDRLYQAAGSSYLGWNHWCFIKNASTGTMTIYLNGVSWASSTGNTGTINTTTAARIGSYAVNTTYYHGYIGNTQLYNRALSATEITQIFNNGRIRFSI
jgi:hypothetical protein